MMELKDQVLMLRLAGAPAGGARQAAEMENTMRKVSSDLSTAEQRGLICDILIDFVADPDVEVLFAYLRHCGLPLQALRSLHDIIPAFLALYRIRPCQYDVDRAFEHLRWWPPIAARMAYLEAEAKAKAEAGAGACVEPEELPHDL